MSRWICASNWRSFHRWSTSSPSLPAHASRAGFWDNLNVGGCYEAAAPGDPNATKCATDLQEEVECYMTACEANCPVTCNPAISGCTASASDFMTSQNNLIGCFNAVLPGTGSGLCDKYGTAAQTDCASFTADSGPVGMCNDAINTLYSTGTPSAAAIKKAWTEMFTVICLPPGGD